MTRPTLATRDPDLAGLRVVVVGLGRSGCAAVRLASARGARVLATDRRDESELGEACAVVRDAGAELGLGGHPAHLVADADLVVVSPGVPLDIPLLVEAKRNGTPVWGEVELSSRYCRGRIVGITGSNGKSTVTAMIGTVLRAAGVPGGTGGNLGTPLADLLVEDSRDAVHAVELSSFQLEAIESFRPHTGVVVNLSPDHLDRYGTFEAYVRAKARLLEVQDDSGFAILNADDPESGRLHASVRGSLLLFSTRREVSLGAWIRDGVLTLNVGSGDEPVMELAELPVPGDHNRANALAAALACRTSGCGPEAIAEGLRSYRALPHRLEHVDTVNGVAFYNDSKATNLDAAVRALESFAEGTVHLILGGRDKGADWEGAVDTLARARRVLLVGEAAPVIEAALSGRVPVEHCETVGRAVRTGADGAGAGDTVLLSPGCASFDQYGDFEARGLDFRSAVEELGCEGGGRA